MTEQEYIDVVNLIRLRDAVHLLRDVVFESSDQYSNDTQATILRRLRKWISQIERRVLESQETNATT